MRYTASSFLSSLGRHVLRSPEYLPEPLPDEYAVSWLDWRFSGAKGEYPGPVPPCDHVLHPLLAGGVQGGSRLQAGGGWTRMIETVRPALQGLADEGLRVWAWKGLDYALSLYPTPWTRPMYDLDLLVEREYLNGVLSVMTAYGWTSPPGEKALFDSGVISELRLFRSGVLVEVHTHPFYFPSIFPGRLPEDLFSQARGLMPGLVGLAHEHRLLLALLHHCQKSSSRQHYWVEEVLLADEVSRSGKWTRLGPALAAAGLAFETGTLLGIVSKLPGSTVPEDLPGELIGGSEGASRLLGMMRAGGGMPTLACMVSLKGHRRLSYMYGLMTGLLSGGKGAANDQDTP